MTTPVPSSPAPTPRSAVGLRLLTAALLGGFVLFALLFHPRPRVVVTDRILYPRFWSYSGLRGSGAPFSSGGIIDSVVVRAQARWPMVVIEPPVVDGGTSERVERLLRTEMDRNGLASHSKALLVAFSPGARYFVCGPGWSGGDVPYGCDTSAVNFAWQRWKVIRACNAVLWNEQGLPFKGGGWIDMAAPGVAEGLAQVIASWTSAPGIFDGAFIDEVSQHILYEQNASERIDFRRHGYPSLEAWDAAYGHGIASLFRTLRELLPPGSLLYGNGGPIGPDSLPNGWLRENFPGQNGGTWSSNMEGWQAVPGDSGYLHDARYARPATNLLTTSREWLAESDPEAQRRTRMVLGSAALGNGAGTMVGTPEDLFRGFLDWWPDEVAVRPDGQSALDPVYRGWLGDPTGPCSRAGSAYLRHFQRGLVIVNPSPLPARVLAGAGYWRLRGRACPVVNDGSYAAAVVVPANDALFLQFRP